MRRIIEGLIHKRKNREKELTEILVKIGEMLEGRGGLFSRNLNLKEQFSHLDRAIRELVLIQDKEWDAYSNNHATRVFKSLEWKIDKLQAEYANLKSLLTRFVELENELDRLLENIREKHPSDRQRKRLHAIRNELSVAQYADFEQRFRGDEEKVKKMLKDYIPFFRNRSHVLDIGCGRGEFLSLLKEENISDYLGIDISDSMLKIATARGLRCIKQEAMSFLREAEPESFGGIFSSQVIEHLYPGDLRDLVMECFRVLAPDSPLILETINPLSVFALSHIYFLDVTHQKPLHPEYMRYLVETSGFSEVEILYSGEFRRERLQAVPVSDDASVVLNTNIDKLNDLLYAAPCYAVKAFKRNKGY